ncbi:MAG TPA: phosphatase PAP2 family protein [Pseudonocardia sp.]
MSDVRAGPPFLSDRWRVAIACVAVVSVVGVAACGWRYAGDRAPGRLDNAIDSHLIPLGEAHYRPFAALAALGSPAVMVLVMIVLLVAVWRTHRYWPAGALVVAGPLLAELTTEMLLKPLFDRTHYGELSLPSGHSTSITAEFTVFLVVFVAVGLPQRVWLRHLLVAAGGFAVFGVCFAEVALDQHYSTDVLAGVFVGACVTAMVTLVLDGGMRALAFRPAEGDLPSRPGDGAA